MSHTQGTPQSILSDAARNAPRNIALLAAAQAIVGSNQSIIMSVGGLTGAELAPDPALATVPTTAMIIGLALAASLATFTIYRLGRRNGFIIGALIAVLAGLLASMAVSSSSFLLFCVALGLVGASAAFGQQYRFAVADSVPETIKARAISFVMLGGVFAGFLGPRLAYDFRNLVGEVEFAGSYLIVSALGLIAIIILIFTRLAPIPKHDASQPQGRSMMELVRTPSIFVPIITGMASYALMTFVMVAAPLAMVHVCGHPVEAATTAIQWHIVSMFAPSFITASIIKRLGVHLTTGLGLVMILLSAAIALNGITTTHFNIALILLGVGWNFGFIGSTTMLANAYRPEEAARAQALNEQLVFGTMAIASIFSGLLLQLIGWQSINVMVIPIATAAIALLAWGESQSRRANAVS